MVQLRALIIDDDALACELLRHHLNDAEPATRVVGEVHSRREAERRLEQNDYDIVFLDVQLPDGTGFDLVPFVHPDAAMIFVTVCDSHAVRAFEVNAIDYLLKPVSSTRLSRALERAVRPRGAHQRALHAFSADDRVFLKGAAAGGRFVPVKDIVAIVSSENYSEVLLADGQKWFVRHTMQAWERSLPRAMFARVHRTAIVNVNRVERIERTADEATSLHLQGVRRPLPVGRRLWSGLKTRLDQRDAP